MSSKKDASLVWTLHLARRQPAKAAVCVALALPAAAGGYYCLGLIGVFAATAILLGSTAEFLFPMKYEITAEGATCRTLLKRFHIEWDNVTRCYQDDDGVKLSPLDRSSRLEAFRGVYLRFNGNREQVIETIRSMRKLA